QHERESRQRLLPAHPGPLARDDERHDAETAATDGDRGVRLVGAPVTAIEGQTAHRMCAFPEVAEGLALDQVEQLLVRQRIGRLLEGGVRCGFRIRHGSWAYVMRVATRSLGLKVGPCGSTSSCICRVKNSSEWPF